MWAFSHHWVVWTPSPVSSSAISFPESPLGAFSPIRGTFQLVAFSIIATVSLAFVCMMIGSLCSHVFLHSVTELMTVMESVTSTRYRDGLALMMATRVAVASPVEFICGTCHGFVETGV